MEKSLKREWLDAFAKVSTVVGVPMVICGSLVFMQKIVFTGTCAFAGYRCEQSLTYATAFAAKVNDAVSGGASATADADMINLRGFPPTSVDKIYEAADKEAKRLNAAGK
jgi:hypothetical protein